MGRRPKMVRDNSRKEAKSPAYSESDSKVETQHLGSGKANGMRVTYFAFVLQNLPHLRQ